MRDIDAMAFLGRRKFLATGGAATLAMSLATLATAKRARAQSPLGELIPDPDGILDLPEGFSYQVLEAKGDEMSDGYIVPGRPDGMACFAGPDDTLILMRNHEVNVGVEDDGPYNADQSAPPEAYEPEGMGGVSRVVIDSGSYARISSNLVLIGTARNCSGGPSPWGWLSCEENVDINGADDQYRHGYTFLCPTDAESLRPPQRIDGYGRFNHEAVAVDPSNSYAYLTEDRDDSCLYRFVPDEFAEPFVGRLQALKIVGEDGFPLETMVTAEALEVEWVDIDEPDPDDDTVRDQARDKGAAVLVRGEGIAFFEGQIYICSTSGGQLGAGQIFRLIDSPDAIGGEPGTLELVVTATDSTALQSPDNLTVAPWGELFIAEDGDGDNYLRWITADGELCTFARNAGSDSELAGVCFSPDGRALFVNVQTEGLTLVVTGPFPEGSGGGDGDGGDGDGGEDTGDDSGETGGELGETGGEPGFEGDGGCTCTTTDPPIGKSALVTGLASVAIASLLKPDKTQAD